MTENLKIKEVKILNDDGTSENVAIGVNASNADMKDGSNVEDRINALNNNIGKIDELESKVNACASGSPKGVYENLQKLKEANPDHNYIYVTTDNGNWNYWSGSTFVSGGVYQSANILENNQLIIDLNQQLYEYQKSIYNNNNIIDKGIPQYGQINSDTGVFLSKPQSKQEICSEKYIIIPKGALIKITKSTSLFNIYYYGDNLEFKKAQYPNSAMKNENIEFVNTEYRYIRIGSWASNNSNEIFNNIKVFIDNKYIKNIMQNGFIFSRYPINFDINNKQLITKNQTIIYLGNKTYDLSNKNYDITKIVNGNFIYYDYINDIINTSKNEHNVLLGALWKNNEHYDIQLFTDAKLQINGFDYIKSDTNYNEIITFLGDSITQGVGCTTPYPKLIPQLTNFNVSVNKGLASSTISRKSDPFPSWDNVTPFVDRLNTIPKESNKIVIFGGINDWVTGRPLGNINSTEDTTFYGALKIICNYLINNFTDKDYLFITPLQTNYIDRPASIPQDNPNYGNKDGKNKEGLIIKDYVNAIIDVCILFSIPVINLYDNFIYGSIKTLGNNNDIDGVYGKDGLHINDLGHKKLALKISKYLN